jgi:hypothetical protein
MYNFTVWGSLVLRRETPHGGDGLHPRRSIHQLVHVLRVCNSLDVVPEELLR